MWQTDKTCDKNYCRKMSCINHELITLSYVLGLDLVVILPTLIINFRHYYHDHIHSFVCWCLKAFSTNVKVWTLAIAPLTWVRLVTSSALQSRRWQLIGMIQWCCSALCGHPLPALTDNWTHGAASRHNIAPISHTRPSPRSRTVRRVRALCRN